MMILGYSAAVLVLTALFAAGMIYAKPLSRRQRRSKIGEIVWSAILAAILVAGYHFGSTMAVVVPLSLAVGGCLWMLAIRWTGR